MTQTTADRGERRRRTRLLERRSLAPGTVELDLARPDGFSFVPGQSIRLFHDQLVRDYSLVNGPDSPVLTVCVRLVEGGAFSSVLRTAGPGTSFDFSGPHGYFVFHPSERPPVWVATGTGIAPFAAMRRSGVTGAFVLHGVRTPQDLYYRRILKSAEAGYVPCIPGSRGEEKGRFPGKVTRFLEERLSAGKYDFYFCGRREMIRDAMRIVDERFPDSRVYTETFF